MAVVVELLECVYTMFGKGLASILNLLPHGLLLFFGADVRSTMMMVSLHAQALISEEVLTNEAKLTEEYKDDGEEH